LPELASAVCGEWSTGFWESVIPIWGSGRSAIDHFQNGRWGWGIFQGVLAITDVFLVKSLVVAGGKLLVKSGAKLLAKETLTYAPRIAEREAAEPLFHGFPRLFDNEILTSGQRIVKSGTYIEYSLPGYINNYQGVYQIGINPATNQITHRFFKPMAKIRGKP
jgi:hypothetical protein